MTHGWTLYPDFDVTGGFLSLFLNLIITVTYRLPATLIDSKPGVKETLLLFFFFFPVGETQEGTISLQKSEIQKPG